MPVLLTKFLIPKTSFFTDRDSFKRRWRDLKRNGVILSGETFSVNQQLIRSAYELRALMPELIELNQEREYDYISGRSDLKYGHHADIGNGPKNDFLLKLNFSPSQKLAVRIAMPKGHNTTIPEHLLNTFQFILSEQH